MPDVDVAVKWTGLKEFDVNLRKVDETVKNRIKAVFEYHKAPATTYAKQNAPWTDRTGNARAGLHSFVESDEDMVRLIIAHTVFYGIYLETRFSGSYAILEPTVTYIGDLIMSRLNGLLDKMDLKYHRDSQGRFASPPADGGSNA